MKDNSTKILPTVKWIPDRSWLLKFLNSDLDESEDEAPVVDEAILFANLIQPFNIYKEADPASWIFERFININESSLYYRITWAIDRSRLLKNSTPEETALIEEF